MTITATTAQGIVHPAIGQVTTFTPKGRPATFHVRATTNDAALVAGIIGEDEYDLAFEKFTGWAIDIGAHIGIVAVALALDNPDLRVVAIEAIPENADMVLRNVAANGLAERVFVESAGASEPGVQTVSITYDYTSAGTADVKIDTGYVSQCRYIGNIWSQYPDAERGATTESVPALSLDAIIERYAMDRVALVKIDCEGCEYAFLDTKAVATVDRIIGEFHQNPQRIQKMLRRTHTVTIRVDRGGVGIFDAVHK